MKAGLILFGVVALESGIGLGVFEWCLDDLINTNHSTRH